MLQRFSTFPDGWPGAGLLLLRATSGVVILSQGFANLGSLTGRGLLLSAMALVMMAIGLLLLIGFLTRAAGLFATLVILRNAFVPFAGVNAAPLDTPVSAALAAVVGTAVICLGAGAFSLDARIFGRREIIIPAGPSKTERVVS